MKCVFNISDIEIEAKDGKDAFSKKANDFSK